MAAAGVLFEGGLYTAMPDIEVAFVAPSIDVLFGRGGAASESGDIAGILGDALS